MDNLTHERMLKRQRQEEYRRMLEEQIKSKPQQEKRFNRPISSNIVKSTVDNNITIKQSERENTFQNEGFNYVNENKQQMHINNNLNNNLYFLQQQLAKENSQYESSFANNRLMSANNTGRSVMNLNSQSIPLSKENLNMHLTESNNPYNNYLQNPYYNYSNVNPSIQEEINTQFNKNHDTNSYFNHYDNNSKSQILSNNQPLDPVEPQQKINPLSVSKELQKKKKLEYQQELLKQIEMDKARKENEKKKLKEEDLNFALKYNIELNLPKGKISNLKNQESKGNYFNNFPVEQQKQVTETINDVKPQIMNKIESNQYIQQIEQPQQLLKFHNKNEQSQFYSNEPINHDSFNNYVSSQYIQQPRQNDLNVNSYLENLNALNSIKNNLQQMENNLYNTQQPQPNTIKNSNQTFFKDEGSIMKFFEDQNRLIKEYQQTLIKINNEKNNAKTSYIYYNKQAELMNQIQHSMDNVKEEIGHINNYENFNQNLKNTTSNISVNKEIDLINYKSKYETLTESNVYNEEYNSYNYLESSRYDIDVEKSLQCETKLVKINNNFEEKGLLESWYDKKKVYSNQINYKDTVVKKEDTLKTHNNVLDLPVFDNTLKTNKDNNNIIDNKDTYNSNLNSNVILNRNYDKSKSMIIKKNTEIRYNNLSRPQSNIKETHQKTDIDEIEVIENKINKGSIIENDSIANFKEHYMKTSNYKQLIEENIQNNSDNDEDFKFEENQDDNAEKAEEDSNINLEDYKEIREYEKLQSKANFFDDNDFPTIKKENTANKHVIQADCK